MSCFLRALSQFCLILTKDLQDILVLLITFSLNFSKHRLVRFREHCQNGLNAVTLILISEKLYELIGGCFGTEYYHEFVGWTDHLLLKKKLRSVGKYFSATLSTSMGLF